MIAILFLLTTANAFPMASEVFKTIHCESDFNLQIQSGRNRQSFKAGKTSVPLASVFIVEVYEGKTKLADIYPVDGIHHKIHDSKKVKIQTDGWSEVYLTYSPDNEKPKNLACELR